MNEEELLAFIDKAFNEIKDLKRDLMMAHVRFESLQKRHDALQKDYDKFFDQTLEGNNPK